MAKHDLEDRLVGFGVTVCRFGEQLPKTALENGPEIWYTSPLGRNGRTQPFPGSVRQQIARINNDRGGLELAGPNIGGDRDYGGPRVHAPN